MSDSRRDIKEMMDAANKHRESIQPLINNVLEKLQKWSRTNLQEDNAFHNQKLICEWELANGGTYSYYSKQYVVTKAALYNIYKEQTNADTTMPTAIIEVPSENNSAYQALINMGVDAHKITNLDASPNKQVFLLRVEEGKLKEVLEKVIVALQRPEVKMNDYASFEGLKALKEELNKPNYKLGEGFFGKKTPANIAELQAILKKLTKDNVRVIYNKIKTTLEKIEIYPDSDYQDPKKKNKRDVFINNFYKKLKNDFGIEEKPVSNLGLKRRSDSL